MTRHLAALVVGLTFVSPLASVEYAAGRSPLTGLDYFAIETLYGQSLYALETGADQGKAVAASFTPDGQWTAPSGTVTGRAAIAQHALTSRGRRAWLTNLSIEPSGEGAEGWACITFSEGLRMVEGGVFHDTLVRTRDGWRVKTRTYLPGTQWPTRPLPVLGPSNNTTSALTATDYAELKHLITRYNLAYDNAGPFDQGLSSLVPFTPDARFDRINGPTFIGKEIAQQSGGHKPLLHHWDTSAYVSVAPDGTVTNFMYDMQFNIEEKGAPVSLNGAGLLHHRYVKTPEGWRVSYRLYEGVGSTPQINWPTAAEAPIAPKLAPEPRVRGEKLSGADYVEIEQLYMRNNIAFDSAADAGRRYADTFTADGVLIRGGDRVTGPAALAGVATSGTPGIHTWISNLTITPSKRGATGRIYALTMVINGEPGVKQSATRGMATIDDILVKTPGGWRIKQRTITPVAAESVR